MFFAKGIKKLREDCKELLILADKICCYRSDVMGEGKLAQLKGGMEKLEELVSSKSENEGELKSAKKSLEGIMREVGGSFYPVRFLPDNLEVILVAAILAIGIRTFFIQPFSIPTNSMYPTYNGMTSEVYRSDEAEPNTGMAFVRRLLKGAKHYETTVQEGGELVIPLFTPKNPLASVGNFEFRPHKGVKWLVIPERQRMYRFEVGGESYGLAVPWDFSMEFVMVKQHFPEFKDFGDFIQAMYAQGRIVMGEDGFKIRTGKMLKAGEDLFNFDILAGDMLFVDRFSYHFKKPEVGEPIVFRTDNIEGLRKADGSPDRRYFIKRLVGEPGDRIAVDEPYLLRNGEIIEGAQAFERNHKREGEYNGYSADRRLDGGKEDVVPEGHYYAMGDNSYNSEDSRYWGFVDGQSMVGKALFIFYPFTHRWGVSE